MVAFCVQNKKGGYILKKSISLFFVFILLVGCSYSSLEEAINEKGYKNVEVLFQDYTDKIVIFSSQNKSNETLLTMNTFSKNERKYKYETGTGEFSKNIDIEDKNEFLKVNQVANSSNAIVWGAVFNYGDAEKISYTLLDLNDNILHESTLVISENNIVTEKLAKGMYDKVEEIHYQVLDNAENVIAEWGY